MNNLEIPVLLSIQTIIPLIGVILLLLTGRKYLALQKVFTGIILLINFWYSILVAGNFDLTRKGFQLQEIYNWLPGFGINFSLAVDGISLPLIVAVSLITFLAFFSTIIKGDHEFRSSAIPLLILSSTLTGIFSTTDAFTFFIFWHLTLIPLYLATVFYKKNQEREYSFLFINLSLVSSVFMLVTLVYMALSQQENSGILTFDVLCWEMLSFSSRVQTYSFLGLLLPFAFRMATFPFHSWLDQSNDNLPTTVKLLALPFSPIVGAYGIIRFIIFLLPEAVVSFQYYIIYLSAFGIAYSLIIAWQKESFQKITNCLISAISGFVLIGIFTIDLDAFYGTLIYLFNSSLIILSLLMLTFFLERRTRFQDVLINDSVLFGMSRWKISFFIALLGFIGIPGTGNFPAILAVLAGLFNTNIFTGFLVLFSIAPAVLLLYQLGKNIIFDSSEKELPIFKLTTREQFLVTIPLSLILFLGIAPGYMVTKFSLHINLVLEKLSGIYLCI